MLLGNLCLPGCHLLKSVANSQRYEVIAFFVDHPCCEIAGVLLCLAQMLQSEQIIVKEAAASVIGVCIQVCGKLNLGSRHSLQQVDKSWL